MALIVETGAGLPDAESYISVADATAYHAARGNAAWAALASDTVREQSLRKGTEYMLQAYRARWQGVRINSTQALDWPRFDVVVDSFDIDADLVPLEVARACAELALKVSAGELLADEERAVLSEKVGPLEVTYDPYSAQAKRFKSIEAMLLPFMGSAPGRITTVRV